MRLSALPPLSLYVHVPWCVRKCPYCDFNSHEARDGIPEDAYVAALIGDLESALPSVWGRRVQSIFFGGGTPSLFSAHAIDTLLSALRARLPLAADCEITLEANPGTVEAAKFRGFRAAGINRLSIGVQSFDSRALQALGRIHDAMEARRAVGSALEYFDNVNLDLMYGLPGQTPDDLQADLDAALSFGVPHLSYYHLTMEPNTLFHRYRPPVPDDDAAAAMQEAIDAALGAAGYANYETSAWARAGRECRHNLNYWRFGDYLGIGAGAHSKLSFPGRVVRQARAKQPKDYLQRSASGALIADEHEVATRDLVFEFMMNALRLAGGFEIALFTERTGLAIAAADAPLELAEARSLIGRDHARIWPTELGRRFLNDLLQLFLPEGNQQ